MNMSVGLYQDTAEAHPYDVVDGIDDVLVEAMWHELDQQLPRERVKCVVAEVALGFQHATVKTFLPILVHRHALERLRQELKQPILDKQR
jgi:hypothetical protein